MKVKELIELLKTFDPELPVARRLYSEQVEMEAEDIEVKELCHPRDDGWIQNKRSDKETTPYLLFAGN